VLSVRQEVRNCSVTYRQRLNDHPNSLAKSLLQWPHYNRRLKRYYPADIAARFNWYSATFPETILSHLWLSLNMRYITGCTSYMPLLVSVNTIAECLRTDCNILGDKIKKSCVNRRLKIQVLYDVTLCCWLGSFRRFEGTAIFRIFSKTQSHYRPGQAQRVPGS